MSYILSRWLRLRRDGCTSCDGCVFDAMVVLRAGLGRIGLSCATGEIAHGLTRTNTDFVGGLM
ncbi:MAG: hypothetical protein V1889_02435 [archaeon]